MTDTVTPELIDAKAAKLFDDIFSDMGSYAEYGHPSYRENAMRKIIAALADHQSAPVAVIRFDHASSGNENEMPKVVSCDWLPDGEYPLYAAPQPAPDHAATLHKLAEVEISLLAAKVTAVDLAGARDDLQAKLQEVREVLQYAHDDLQLRAEVRDGERIVAGGCGVWNRICETLAQIKEAK